MLGISVSGYTRTCSAFVGGLDILLVGDAEDFVLTEGTPAANGDPSGYSAIALRSGATAAGGAYLYPIDSLQDSLNVEITQSNPDGSSSSYEYVITAKMAQMSQSLTNFNKKIDAAAACGQLIFVWRTNDGKIQVAGEKYVNGDSIPKFRFRQDGTKVSSGKKFSDFNGQDLSLKADYLRTPYEFTGGISSIEALMP